MKNFSYLEGGMLIIAIEKRKASPVRGSKKVKRQNCVFSFPYYFQFSTSLVNPSSIPGRGTVSAATAGMVAMTVPFRRMRT